MKDRILHILNMSYRNNNIIIHCKDILKDQYIDVVIVDFFPYFYITDNDENLKLINNLKRSGFIKKWELGFVSFDNKALIKVVFNNVQTLINIRKNLQRCGIKLYESDIPYTRRFLIDHNIFTYFKLKIDINNKSRIFCKCKDLIPINNIDHNPKIWYLDIEVDAKSLNELKNYKKPIISIQNLINNNYDQYVLDNGNRHSNNIDNVIYVSNELSLFTKINKYIEENKPDFICGWNIEFDIDYMLNRAKRLMKNDNNIKVLQKFIDNINSLGYIDLYQIYRRLYKSESYKLKMVALKEGITDNIVSESFEIESYYNDFNNFIKYCFDDVDFLDKLNKKLHLLEFVISIRNITGLENFESCNHNSTIIDILYLRRAFLKKIVLPTSNKEVFNNKEISYQGAIVLEPKSGVYKNIAVFDFTRYYPTIMLAFELFPEGKEIGITKDLIYYLIEKRLEYDKRLKNIKHNSIEYHIIYSLRNSYKFLLNSMYGVFGFKYFRLFDINIASRVTEEARKGIIAIKEFFEENGFEVIYGDTDSVFVKHNDINEFFNINEKLQKFLEDYKDRRKMKEKYEMKLEKIFDTVIFTNVKKRYAGRVIWDGEFLKESYDYIKGFETVRRDAAKISKDLQRKIFDYIFKGKTREDIINLLRKVISKIRKFDPEYLCSKMKLTKDFNKYKVMSGHLKAALASNTFLGENITIGDSFFICPVIKLKKGYIKTKSIAFTKINKKKTLSQVIIDYKTIIEKNILKKLESILQVLGIDKNDIYYRKLV